MQFVVAFGQPTVGKMTVGRAAVERSDFRLFHNHTMIEPLPEVFDDGTPPFLRLLGELRRQVVEEEGASGTDLESRPLSLSCRRPLGGRVARVPG